MTKKERVLHAFHNEPVDRVPIAFWYHFSPDDDFGQETIGTRSTGSLWNA